MKNFYIIILFAVLSSCTKYPAKIEAALEIAGENRHELEKVLSHYSNPEDSLRLKAAYDIIGEMPGKVHFDNPETDYIVREFGKQLPEQKKLYKAMGISYEVIYDSLLFKNKNLFSKSNPIPDISVITSEILIENIDMAFYVWENMPWAKYLSYDYFRDYILPYKTGQTKPELWRKKLFNQYKWLLDSIDNESDPVEACILLNDSLKSNFTHHVNVSPNNLSQIIDLQGGGCTASSILALYFMRAMGIPVHITTTLIAGNPPFRGTHVENVVLTKELGLTRFPGSLKSSFEEWSEDYRGKWFVEMDRVNKNWITEQTQDIKNVPPNLHDNRLVDITKEFSNSFSVKLKTQVDRTVFTAGITHAYLCVSTRQGRWAAIDFTPFSKDSIVFRNIEPGVYFPMIYLNDQFHQCASPFKLLSTGAITPILSENSNTTSTQTLKLYRKYPMNEHTKQRSAYLIGDIFECSNNADFLNPTTIHTIRDSTMHITDVEIKDENSYKYIRYNVKTIAPPTKFVELKFYGKSGSLEQEIEGELVYSDKNVPRLINHVEHAFDNNYLTYFHLESVLRKTSDVWFGVEFEKPTRISKIRYMCESDLNCIFPGHSYELYYLDDASWIPIERKVAETNYVDFNYVPTNKIYLLRNLTEGKEEYSFTYENGKQVWW